MDGWDGMGWDWMVIIGHRSRKSTFGTNNQKRKSLLRYYSSRLRSKVLLKVNIKTNMSKRVRGKRNCFGTLMLNVRYILTIISWLICFNRYIAIH